MAATGVTGSRTAAGGDGASGGGVRRTGPRTGSTESDSTGIETAAGMNSERTACGAGRDTMGAALRTDVPVGAIGAADRVGIAGRAALCTVRAARVTGAEGTVAVRTGGTDASAGGAGGATAVGAAAGGIGATETGARGATAGGTAAVTTGATGITTATGVSAVTTGATGVATTTGTGAIGAGELGAKAITAGATGAAATGTGAVGAAIATTGVLRTAAGAAAAAGRGTATGGFSGLGLNVAIVRRSSDSAVAVRALG